SPRARRGRSQVATAAVIDAKAASEHNSAARSADTSRSTAPAAYNVTELDNRYQGSGLRGRWARSPQHVMTSAPVPTISVVTRAADRSPVTSGTATTTDQTARSTAQHRVLK